MPGSHSKEKSLSSSSKVSRRTALQLLLSGFGAFLPNPLSGSAVEASSVPIKQTELPNDENATAEIVRQVSEFSRQEIYRFPNQFIDNVLLHIDQMPLERQEQYSRLVSMFSEGGPGISAERNRKILEIFAEKYAVRLDDLLTRFEALDSQRELVSTFQALSRFSRPLLDLQRLLQLSQPTNSEIDYAVTAVQDLLFWLSTELDQKTEVDQRRRYNTQAGLSEMSNGLWYNIAQEWQHNRTTGDLVERERNEVSFSRENEVRLVTILQSFKSYFPRILARTRHLSFTDDERALSSGRSFFEPYSGQANFVSQFFLSSNSGEMGIERDIIVFAHELSHSFDPDGFSDRTWDWAPPADFLAYHEGYAELFEGFQRFTQGESQKNVPPLSPEGLEYFMISPWFEGMNFGIDQLRSREDWSICRREIEQVQDLTSDFMNSPEGMALLRSSNLAYFFTEKEEPLLNWKIRANSRYPNGTRMHNPFYSEWVAGQLDKPSPDAPEWIQDLPTLSQFSHFDPQMLGELIALGDALFEGPLQFTTDAEVAEIKKTLLNIKSLSILVFTVLRQRIMQFGGLNSPTVPALQALQNWPLARLVNSHFIHLMTGPLGQYTPLARRTVRSREEDANIQASLEYASTETVRFLRDTQDAILGSSRDPNDEEDRKRADAFAGFLHHQAQRIWKLRETLWGAEGEYVFPHAVKDISLNIFPQLPAEDDGKW